MYLLSDNPISIDPYLVTKSRTALTISYVGGSLDGKTMDWQRHVPLPRWVRTGDNAADYYRVDESTGVPRYVHVSMVNQKPHVAEIPLEIRNNSPIICPDTLGEFPVLIREKPYRERRFELWIQGCLVGYFPTRELAEHTGRRVVQLQMPHAHGCD